MKKKFSKEEDKQLYYYVNLYGTNQWNKIISFFKNRTIKSIKERFYKYLNLKINNQVWTDEEDNLLLINIQRYGHKWRIIAQNFPERTEVQLKNRFKYLKQN